MTKDRATYERYRKYLKERRETDILTLVEETGFSINECSLAYDRCGGDISKSIKSLRSPR